MAADGNIGASPIPSNTRRPMKPAKLLTMPKVDCATDQASNEAPRAILLPSRSMIRPIGNCAKA
ncbi:hypothetical protein D3C80_2069090 [compost metagenome]